MLTPLAPGDAQRLRAFFTETGYTNESFRKQSALRELPQRPANLPFLLEVTRELTPLNILLHWFFLTVPVEQAIAESALPAGVLGILLSCGLLAQEGSEFHGQAMLTPVDDLLFAADSAGRMRAGLSSDLVLWPNPTTRVLQLFATRTPSKCTLDLGAGCGIQSVFAAAYSERVIATDLNERAEQFTLFNAALNGIANIEYRNGDTFEPVLDTTFDRILANPPFFVTPGSSQLFCENPMELDNYCRRVVREAPARLVEGGWFQAVLEWVQVEGQPWRERLSEWIEGSGCDAWIVRNYVRDAADYAAERLRDSGSTAEIQERFAQWMEYYRARRVEAVHGGLIALRRRSGKNWVHIVELPAEMTVPFGDTVLAVFANQDVLSRDPTDEELLAFKPVLAPEAHLAQELGVENGEWRTVVLRLQLAGSLPATMDVQSQVADFLCRCDGSTTLGAMTAQFADRVGAPLEMVRKQVCAVVRKLAARRFLLLR